MRLIVVIDAARQAAANRAAARIDKTGGTKAFTVPLADPATPTTPAAYWCSWDLAATGHNPDLLFAELEREGVSPTAKPTNAPSRTRPINTFDAAQWTPDAVLDALGLQRIETDLP